MAPETAKMSETIKGHCNCNAHEYTIPRPNQDSQMNLCHCTDCRRWAGALHSAHIFTPKSSIRHDGPEPRTHKVTGIDGKEMIRAWCDDCGCGLWIGTGGETFLKAGLFEPGETPKPTIETFTKDMESWERTTPGVKTFEKNTDQL